MDDLESLFVLLAGMPRARLALAHVAISDYREIADGPRPVFSFVTEARTAIDRLARDLRPLHRQLAAQLFSSDLDSVDGIRAAFALVEGAPVVGPTGANQTTLAQLVGLLAWHMATEHAALRDVFDPNKYAVPR